MSGELRLQPHRVGTNDPPALLAELVGDGGGILLPPLHGAMVRRVTKGGMVIRGTEILSRGGVEGAGAELSADLVVLGLDGGCRAGGVDLNPMGRE